jgi:Flagellar biosynthesis protein, FliO
MPPANRSRWSPRAAVTLFALVVILATGGSIALLNARASTERKDQPRNSRPDEAAQVVSATTGPTPASNPDEIVGPPGPDSHSRTPRSFLSRRFARADRTEGSDNWYLGMAGIAILLALGGGIAAAARRFAPGNGAGTLQVISRVGLSPKHTVYLLRAGGRVLLVGTGPQGAPSLISELDEIPQVEPAIGQGDTA